MSLDEAWTWLSTYEGLATWIGLVVTLCLFVAGGARLLYQALSRSTAKRRAIQAVAIEAKEVARSGTVAVEQAASELPLLAEAANSAGKEELRRLASKAEGHFDDIRASALRATDSALKSELNNAAKGVTEFRDAVMNWHGLHDSDDSQRLTGRTAIERVQTSAQNLKKWL